MKKSAFTLIELSVILLVLSILAIGVLLVTTTNVENKKIAITKKRMETIYKALAVYVIKEGNLPCPASLINKKDATNYGVLIGTEGDCSNDLASDGVYASSAQSNIIYGAVPVISLSLPIEMAEDGFGGKIIYAVSQFHTKSEFPTLTDNEGFSFYDTGSTSLMTVINRASDDVKTDVMFVLMSLGENKYGGFNADSISQNSTTSSNAYEQDNYIKNINTASFPYQADFGEDASYPSQVVFNLSDDNDSSFDDILFFKSRRDLFQDFPEAKFLAGCNSEDSGWSSNYGLAFYDAVDYRATDCVATPGMYPAKICTSFGDVWVLRV